MHSASSCQCNPSMQKQAVDNLDNISRTRISSGDLAGNCRDGVVEYLGVPYAAPPVRFQLPQERAPWSGVFEAVERGPTAPHKIRDVPQIDATVLVGSGSDGGDGDYLRANIWAPEGVTKAPVMVWIHGGGYVVGSKDAPVSDGTAFAKSGNVCIAINYRMGIDGFLPVPWAPTNLGLRDMLFALEWVNENAVDFGGDPQNITVFGESAGGMAIANLVASPLAKGLFDRAIIQSGHGAMVREISVAQKLVKKLAKKLGVTPDVDGFRNVSFEDGWAAIEKLAKPWAIDLRDKNMTGHMHLLVTFCEQMHLIDGKGGEGRSLGCPDPESQQVRSSFSIHHQRRSSSW